IVVTMTAHIHDQDVTAVVRCQLLGQILDLYAGNYAINLVLAIQPDTVADVDNGRDEKNLSESMTGGLKSASNGGKEIMKQVTDRSISRDVETHSNDVQPKKIEQRHSHASGKRRGHGVESGNKLGEQQSELAPLVERLCGTQDAAFGIDGKSAEDRQQAPAHPPTQDK